MQRRCLKAFLTCIGGVIQKRIGVEFVLSLAVLMLSTYLSGDQMVKMEDSYLGMLHKDSYSDYNYYGSQVYVPAESPGPSTV